MQGGVQAVVNAAAYLAKSGVALPAAAQAAAAAAHCASGGWLSPADNDYPYPIRKDLRQALTEIEQEEIAKQTETDRRKTILDSSGTRAKKPRTGPYDYGSPAWNDRVAHDEAIAGKTWEEIVEHGRAQWQAELDRRFAEGQQAAAEEANLAAKAEIDELRQAESRKRPRQPDSEDEDCVVTKVTTTADRAAEARRGAIDLDGVPDIAAVASAAKAMSNRSSRADETRRVVIDLTD